MLEEVEQQAQAPEQKAASEIASDETASSSANEEEQQQEQTEEQRQQEEEHKRKGGFQRRIDKLTRDKSEAERERDYWRQVALDKERGGSKEEKSSESAAKTAGEKPRPEKYNSDIEYLEALTEWKFEQREKVHETKQKDQSVIEHRQKAAKDFDQKAEEFGKTAPDFAETVEDLKDIAFSPTAGPLLAEIVEHEYGPQLAYYLGKNLDVAERLSKMGPMQVAREVGRLEAMFVPQDGERAAVSKAPRPPTPVGKSSTSTSAKDPGEMSPEEYRQWRRKQFPDL